MKDNKGFTMIELIGVLIIMALLIMIVFPTTVRLMRDNEEQRFDYYYDIILKGADTYASNRRDDLGGIDGVGCVDDITLSELIDKNYVKVFDDEEVTCGSPSEFLDATGNSTLSDLSFDADTYVDIKLSNEKGKISSEASLICVSGRKIVYKKLIEKTSDYSCDRYVASINKILYTDITGGYKDTETNKLAVSTDDNVTYFVNGSSANNYVWYSGKLWRIVSYNTSDRTVKLVTDSSVSTLSYSGSTSSFLNSNIYIWLNDKFLDTLDRINLYLLDSYWDYSTVADASIPSGTDTVRSKVGLLNYYEYNKVNGFLNISKNWWLLSKYSDTNSWFVNSSNAVSNLGSNQFNGVRPSIVLKANVPHSSNIGYVADGTISKPYVLVGSEPGKADTLLNDRFVGEYVNFRGNVYRITEINKEYVRIVANDNIRVVVNGTEKNTLPFSYFLENNSYYNGENEVGKYLYSTWLPGLPNSSEVIVKGDFCIVPVVPGSIQTSGCAVEDTINEQIALPKIGDLFTAGNSSQYWTISRFDNNSVNVVNADNSVGPLKVYDEGSGSYLESGVRPVVNLFTTTKITGGNGTLANPYTIG